MNNTSKVLIAALVVGALFASVPTANAATYNAGTIVGAADQDVTHTLKALIAPGGPYDTLCYLDNNGNAKADVDEPLYLMKATAAGTCGAPTNFPAGTLRLSATSGKTAGSLMGGSDSDTPLSGGAINTGLTPLFKYFDANGNSLYDAGDTVILSLVSATTTAAIGDVAFNSAGFERITASSALFNKPITAVSTGGVAAAARVVFATPALASTFAQQLGAIGFYDSNGDAKFGVGDFVYILPSLNGAAFGATTVPKVNDVRLTSVGTYPAGSVATATDTDIQRLLAALPTPMTVTCFLDLNGNAGLDGDEPVYLQAAACGAASIAAGDIRLGAYGGKNAGTIVGGADQEIGKTTTAVTMVACYFDDNGNGIYDAGDALYLHVGACAAGKVVVNDIELWNGFARVTASTTGYNRPLLAPAQTIFAGVKFYDANGDGKYTQADVVYYQATANAFPSVNDVRFTAFGGKAAGSLVKVGDFDATVVLNAATPFIAGCYIDLNGNAKTDTDEPVILNRQACATGVLVGGVRLSEYGGKAAGTTIGGGDAEIGKTWIGVSGTGAFRYFDANGNGIYDLGDIVYFTSAGAGANVAVGDLEIGSGFARVTSSSAGFNRPLAGTILAVTAIKCYDANGDAACGVADAYYLPVAGLGFPSVMDVRLTGVTASQNTGSGGNPATLTGTSTSVSSSSSTSVSSSSSSQPPASSSTSAAPNTSSSTGPVSTENTGSSSSSATTPGFELVALAAALGAALVLVRRKL